MGLVKDLRGKPVTFYRGSIDHPDCADARSTTTAIYFSASKDVANMYAMPLHPVAEPMFVGLTNRINIAHLSMEKVFVASHSDPYLELSHLEEHLGYAEATRIAEKFKLWVMGTDAWRDINIGGRYKSPQEYFDTGGELCDLCLQAWPFFADDAEVEKLKSLGYDGAIHGGCGFASAGTTEYCVFSPSQIHYP